MKRFDRYVLGGFAAALGATLALILVLYVVIDAFQHLDDFVGHFRREGMLVGLGVVLRYYACRFLSDVSSFGEILALVPALVVAAAMARAGEFVAPLAAGVSIRRMALPIFVSCALVGAGAFVFRNLAGPALVRRTLADKRRIYNQAGTLGSSLSVQGSYRRGATQPQMNVCYQPRSSKPLRSQIAEQRETGGPSSAAVLTNVHLRSSAVPVAVALSVESYDASRSRGEGFAAAVIEPGKPFLDIRAPVAVWDEGDGAWRFPRGGTRWCYGGKRGYSPFPQSGPSGASGKNVNVPFSPTRRTPGEKAAPAFEKVAEFRTVLGADLLEAEELGPGVLSLGALWSQRARPEFARALHGRLAQILAPVALALAALPFVLTTDRSRVFQRVCLAILVASAYEVALRGTAAYVGAFLGAWLPPAAFAAFGGWRLATIET